MAAFLFNFIHNLTPLGFFTLWLTVLVAFALVATKLSKED